MKKTSTKKSLIIRKFKPGELVRLVSGGPIMTVDRYDSIGRVECVYFAGAGEHRFVETTTLSEGALVSVGLQATKDEAPSTLENTLPADAS